MQQLHALQPSHHAANAAKKQSKQLTRHQAQHAFEFELLFATRPLSSQKSKLHQSQAGSTAKSKTKRIRNNGQHNDAHC